MVAVGTCRGCGRGLCLACAVPVRGELYGSECVGDVLGAPVGDEAVARPARDLSGLPTPLGLVGAVVASALPWSTPRSSFGRGPFGGWQVSPVSWSILASGAAVLGLALWLWWRIRRRPLTAGRRATLLATVCLIAAGAMLYVAGPPFASRPGVGPWAALVTALMAGFGLLWTGRRSKVGVRRPRRS